MKIVGAVTRSGCSEFFSVPTGALRQRDGKSRLKSLVTQALVKFALRSIAAKRCEN
ncbi:hypothetical protein AB0M48_32370 [Lentzea sp. NPDC051208]|uniref:hypothetical protein n=1 Tax=Lentzea sp. NPDC051208 TaxID=3154642 RepID=UPI00343853A5